MSKIQEKIIRFMQPSDVSEVVNVHLASFSFFFLSTLGPHFLRLFYTEVLAERDHIAFVAVNEHHKIVGFVTGVTRQTGFYKRLLYRRWWAFAAASISAIVRRPLIIPRLWRALNYSRLSKSASAQALLLSIAVVPEESGRGIGQSLVHKFLEAAQQRAIPAVCLTTDRDNNDYVNNFYLRLGFVVSRSFMTPERRWMNEYLYVFKGANEP